MSRKARRRPSWKKDHWFFRGYRLQYFSDGGIHIYPKSLEKELAEILVKEIEAEYQNEFGMSSEEANQKWNEQVKDRMRDYISQNRMV
jgi:hypothetical protein